VFLTNPPFDSTKSSNLLPSPLLIPQIMQNHRNVHYQQGYSRPVQFVMQTFVGLGIRLNLPISLLRPTAPHTPRPRAIAATAQPQGESDSVSAIDAARGTETISSHSISLTFNQPLTAHHFKPIRPKDPPPAQSINQCVSFSVVGRR